MGSIVILGWYLPMAIFMARDPIVRDVVSNLCVISLQKLSRGLRALARVGGIFALRQSIRAVASLRRLREGWCLVDHSECSFPARM